MAIYHLACKIIGRSSGRSVVAAACYRSGTKMRDEETGIVYDYTRKKGIEYSEILAPDHAPEWATDRKELWNRVQEIEKPKDARLAREIECSLPKELNYEERLKLVREYAKDFVSQGMVVDFSLHNPKGKENPHVHFLLTTRPFEQDGTWGAKAKKEYLLDENGQKIKTAKGNYKSRKIDTVDWNKTETLELWRKNWEVKANLALERAGHNERIDCRNYEAQGVEKVPTSHLGVSAAAMERRGIQTVKGDINRWVKEQNKNIENLRSEIISMEEYIKNKVKLKERQPIYKTVGELKKLCDETIVQNSQESAILLAEYQKGKKEEITDKKALPMAISRYYGNDYRKLMESIRNGNLEESKLNEKIIEFNKKPAPSFFSFKQKKEHQKEYDDLIKWKTDLAARKEINDKKYAALKKDMDGPKVKAQIYKIRDEILKGNVARKDELNSMYADYKKLKDDIKSLAGVKKVLGYEKSDKVISIPETSRTLKSVDLLKSVATDLSKTQSQGLQVRINSSDYER